MARTRSERARSKAAAIDDLAQSIEQLQAFLPKMEDLGREGFPYLEGARARTELQLRECIKRAFGEKSPEFQSHRHHKLSVSSDAKQTVRLIRNLIATLEDKRLELQGLKPEAATASDPARPQMTLVPPLAPPAQVTVTSAASSIPPPVTVAVPLAASVAMSAPVTGPATVPPMAVPAPPSPIESAAPPPPAPPAQPKPQRASIEPISSLFQTQETRPVTSAPKQVEPPTTVLPPQPIAPARFSTTQEVRVPPQSTVTSVPPTTQTLTETDHLNLTKKLCQRFHFVARQLRLRGEYRTTLTVEDELDVQDLLHALLRLQFDDISMDEWIPSYTNGAPRTTFLLHHDRLAVVVKKTRTGLSAKDLGDQVRTDIERYRTRGRCTNLFCFIYDPEGRIGNPSGLESDLTSSSENFTVAVLVAPK
jgi:REase_DpnII-MboI